MRALVTGAGGFVGAHLVRRLVDDGWEVVAAVRPGPGAVRPLPAGARVVPVDLSEPAQVEALADAARPDAAFLLAAARARSTPDERATTLAVNALGVGWLLDALADRCGTVVRLGSSTEYAAWDGPMDEAVPVRPRTFFGATKAWGSRLAARPGRRAVVLRAFQIYGPGDHPHRLVPRALAAARHGTPLALTSPGRRRDWVYVDDVVEACVRAAATAMPPGTVLNVGTGRQVANEELVATVCRVTGRAIDVRPGAHPGRPWDRASWVCDAGRAREVLGWKARTGLAAGLGSCWRAVGQ